MTVPSSGSRTEDNGCRAMARDSELGPPLPLADLHQVTVPVCLSFPICKMRIMIPIAFVKCWESCS